MFMWKNDLFFFTLRNFYLTKRKTTMKKIFIRILVFEAAMLFFASIANAQYSKSDKLLNLGIGVNSYYGGGIPLGASLEVGITDDISAGGEFDFASGNKGSADWGYTSYYIGARGSYHLSKILNLNNDKLDVYAGLGLGYRGFKWKESSYGFGYSYNSGINLNYFAGGRYELNNNLGAFVELGYIGLSNAKIGVALKF